MARNRGHLLLGISVSFLLDLFLFTLCLQADLLKEYEDRKVTYFGGYLDEKSLNQYEVLGYLTETQLNAKKMMLKTAKEVENIAEELRQAAHENKAIAKRRQQLFVSKIKAYAKAWGYELPEKAIWNVPDKSRSQDKCNIDANHEVCTKASVVVSATWHIKEKGKWVPKRFELYGGFFDEKGITKGAEGPIRNGTPGKLFTIAGKIIDFKSNLDLYKLGVTPSNRVKNRSIYIEPFSANDKIRRTILREKEPHSPNRRMRQVHH